ncbi:MAG TPA: rhodanese-like domain-containing protein [Anaerolineae bacterium]|jgi:rhodanese-related sulfurtransferase
MDLLKRLFGGVEPDEGTSTQQRTVIDARGLAEKLKTAQAPYLLDVREPYEYQAAHITGAQLIPMGNLKRQLHRLPHDRDIVCVCQTGSRSSAVTETLIAFGYNAINLRGGMIAWLRAGGAVTRAH